MKIDIINLTLHFQFGNGRGYIAHMYPGTDRKGQPEPRVDWIVTGPPPALPETQAAEIGQMNTMLQVFLKGGFDALARMDANAAVSADTVKRIHEVKR